MLPATTRWAAGSTRRSTCGKRGVNYVATYGRIVVNQVTATMVSAGAHFLFDGNNVVDGQFQAQICPP